MRTIWVLPLTCIIVFLIGCSAHKSADGPSHTTTRIVDIILGENSESLILTIKGNGYLTYTAGMQATPLGLLIQFPDTGLELKPNRFYPMDNQFINVIQTAEINENNTATANIFIGLKKDSPYNLLPVDKGLQVVFAKSPALSDGAEPKQETANPPPKPKPNQGNLPTATVLKAVASKSLADSLIIEVEANGTIKNYKTFTMQNPARIIFDFYRVKSPYRDEHRVDIESKSVKRIRYFGHPDKLRLVLETSDAFLSDYASFPTHTGLLIQVGGVAANASQPQNVMK